ncbi:carbohydrate deacetylase [Lutispora sp.]|uniref:carbohydrate deacetylase n=1 Tax=Lutispora sp. TaxID=2828727 RepID=UPI00356405BB
MNEKFLIVNADDFGLSESVTEGILYAHSEGIVTSTTVMVNQYHAETSIKKCIAYPKLGVGIHLVFNKGVPIMKPSEIYSLLTNEGIFHKNIYSIRELVNPNHLYKEFCAQIDKFSELMGCLPDHMDCHHWAILHDDFFEVYVEVANLYNLPIRLPFPEISDFSDKNLKNLLGDVPVINLKERIERLKIIASERNVKCPDYFKANFFGDQATFNTIQEVIRDLKPGVTEIMTHPGYIDKYLKSTSSYCEVRYRELEIITSSYIKDLITENKIKLVSFKQLNSYLDGQEVVAL